MKPANEITAIWARNVTIIKAAATKMCIRDRNRRAPQTKEANS